MVFILTFCSVLLISAFILTSCGSQQDEVVVYTAIDEVFAEDIISGFEESTGIKVQVVYDTEANKTTGLVNRIVSESRHPMCDVFWNNEFMQTIELANRGLLEAYESPEAATIPDYYKASDHTWTAVGGRARVFLVNTGLLDEQEYPRGVTDLASDRYPGEQIAIAYPMFGTTRTMAAALYAEWGEEEARSFFQTLSDRGVQVVDGNSVTKDMAVSGQAAIGFTDSDDAREAISDGADVVMIYPDQGSAGMGTLMTPSTVALIKGGPDPDNGKLFIDYILSENTERELVNKGFYDCSIRDCDKNDSIKGMEVSLEEIYSYMDTSARDMEQIFATAR